MPVPYNTYLIDQPILLVDLITDPRTGDPVADPSDAVTVFQPDGTPSTPPTIVDPDDPNGYAAVFVPSMAGWHEYIWRSTGAGSGAGRKTFYVSPVP